MHSFFHDHIDELQAICERHRALRLELFGSATRDDFDEQRSDLDFLVVFGSVPMNERANQYFGMQHDLEALFGRPVDLTELLTIENPFFLRSIKPSRVVLYDAA